MRRTRRLSKWYVPALCLLAGACSANGDGGGLVVAGSSVSGSSVAGSNSGSSPAATGASSTGSTASSVGSTAAGSAGSAGAGSAGGTGVGAGGAAGAPADGGVAMGTMDSGGVVTTGDAGGVGAFGYSGASRCATSGVLLCESFENGIDSAVWTPLTTVDGTVVVDDLHAARGSKALHVKVVNAGKKAAISETKTFPIANNVLFARMFVWFDAFTTNAHFTMAEAPQATAGAWIRFGGQFGKFGVGTDHGASGDWLQPDTVPVPTKHWTCIEFEFKGDTNEFHVWQDDVERTTLNTGATKHAGFVIPPMTSLWFGWQTYSNQSPGEFWIDEIAVDSKPIGCTK